MAAVISPNTTGAPPTKARFADSFWDASDRGVDVLVEKLRTSKQTCEEIKKLYEIRSQIEEDYGERLLKLSQLIVGQAEEGTLSESLSHIPSALETTGRAHLDLAQQLKHHLEAPLEGFLKEQRETRRSQHQQIENARQLRNMHHTNAIKAKEFYTAECTKVAGMEKYLRERGATMSRDELQQVREEIEEGKKMMMAAAQEYKRAVEVYNSVTTDWIQSWRNACDIFQDMEEKRIGYIHNSLWAFSSMMSSVYLVDDQCCERIRTTLELTNMERDINEFIQHYGTGSNLPEMMQFEPFVSIDMHGTPSAQLTPASSIHQDMNGLDAKALPLMPAPTPSPPMQPSSDEGAKSLERQLEDLGVKATNTDTDLAETQREVEQQQQPTEPTQTTEHADAVASAMREVEAMVLVDEKKSMDKQPTSETHVPTPPAIVNEEQPAKQNDIQQSFIQDVSPMPEALKESPEPVSSPRPETKEHRDEHEAFSADNVPEMSAATTAAAATAAEPSMESERPASLKSSIKSKDDEKYKPVPNLTFVASVEDTKSPSEKSPQMQVQTTAAAAVQSRAEPKTAPAEETRDTKKDDSDEKQNERQADIKETNQSTGAVGVQLQDNLSVSDDGSVQYTRPPPKDEKWVISSIRRPQQLPVRAQNARMYDGQPASRTNTPRSSMLQSSSPSQQQQQNAMHVDAAAQVFSKHEGNNSAPTKSNRPHPNLKIEIPNKISSAPPPAAAPAQTTQAVAQQVIAAGRAQAHQTSSWQATPSQPNNGRYGSMYEEEYDVSAKDPALMPTLYHGDHSNNDSHNNHQGVELHDRSVSYEDETHLPEPISESVSNNSGTGGKKKFGKLMKGMLKNSNEPAGPTSSFDKNRPSLQPPAKEKDKGNRFSLNIFGGKKDKRHHAADESPEVAAAAVASSTSLNEQLGSASNNNSNSHIIERPRTSYVYEHSMGAGSAPVATAPLGPRGSVAMASPMNAPSGRPSSFAAMSPRPSSAKFQRYLTDGTPVMEYVRAIWSYEAKIPSEMSFQAGDVLAVIHRQVDGWWEAEHPQRRQRGLIPGNYFESA